MRDKFKYIEADDLSILYHVESAEFFVLSSADYIDQIKEYLQCGHENPETVKMLADLDQKLQNGEKQVTDNKSPEVNFVPKEFGINSVVLSVTNQCNFQCRYCYAKKTYAQYQDVLTIAQAQQTVDFFINNFKRVNLFHFFGGEPTLNPEVIEFVCKYLEEKHQTGQIDYMPNFSIITNGYNLTEEFIELAKKYQMKITLSVDGPDFIHDNIRRTRDCEPTFHHVKASYEKLLKSGFKSDDIYAETIYTAEHLRQDFSIVDLIKFAANEFKVKEMTMPPVTIDREHDLNICHYREKYQRYVEESVDFVFKNILQGEKITNDVIYSIIKHLFLKIHNPRICHAGYEMFSISPQGGIYPCFRFMGTEYLKLGSIADSPQLVLDNLVHFLTKINTKEHFTKCHTCWARGVCQCCLSAFYDYENDCFADPEEIHCLTIETILRKVILNVVQYRNEPDFTDNLEKFVFGAERLKEV